MAGGAVTRFLSADSWSEAILKGAVLVAGANIVARHFVSTSAKDLLYQKYLIDLEVKPKPAEVVELWRKDGTEAIPAWFVKGEGASEETPRPLVIFSHGKSGRIEYNLWLAQEYAKAGISTLLVELRGFGKSGGVPSEQNFIKDFKYFYDQVIEMPEVDRTAVFLQGHSLGGGVVMNLARFRKPAGIILGSAFTSFPELAKTYYIPSFWITEKYDNLAAVRDFDGPMLIFHGREDGIVPFEHGKELARASRNAKFIDLDCDHSCDVPINEITGFIWSHAGRKR